MRKFLIWLAPALLLFSCSTAQKAVYTPDQLLPTEKTLLWKISGNGLSKPSFLYGTIHMIEKSELNFSDAILESLDKSSRITFEIDMKEMTSLSTQISLMTKAFMRDGKSLRDLLNEEDYTLVRDRMEEKGMGMGMFERLKPMFLSMMLSNEEESGPSGKMTSVEMELYRLAKKRKIGSAGLETAAYQMSVFDSIPYADQARMLVDGLRNEAGSQGFHQLMELYRNQDINAMQSIVVEEGESMQAYEELLLNKRNRNWIPVMARMMKETPTFFAVGAGHLGGPVGVIALLRKEGYRVEAIF
jgi:uncharacterized protein